MLGTLNTKRDCLLSMADCDLQSGQMMPWWQTTVVSDELKAQRKWSSHRALLRYADSGVSLQDAVAPPLRTPKQIHEADRHTCRPRGREFSPLDQLMRHEGRGQDGQAAATSQAVDVAKFYLMVGTVLLAPLVIGHTTRNKLKRVTHCPSRMDPVTVAHRQAYWNRVKADLQYTRRLLRS